LDWNRAMNFYIYQNESKINNFIFIRNTKTSRSMMYFLGSINIE
jgi:hypothetical protein